jgi:hypothetical protein
MRTLAKLLIVWVCLAVLPTVARAQGGAALAGLVTDTSGAVLPGVTVEARSPELIEQVRSTVTDETGRYRIVDLRTGTYTVTFVLPGFATVVREGIQLTGTFTATVDAQLRVGALEETVSVVAESPIVDIQSSQTQQTLASEIINAIPTGRQYYSLTTLVPALNVQGNDVGGIAGPIFSVFQAHGGRRDEGQVKIEGLSMGFQGFGVSFYVPDVGNAQEVSFTISPGGLGEATTGGPIMNVIPRQGGNTFSGTIFVNGASGRLQGSNFTQAHRDAGLRAPNRLKKLWDINGAFGGPILRDRLWFYWTGRHQGNRKLVAGMWHNKNAGDRTKWTYEPDFDRQAVDDGTWRNTSLRLTWQASPRNKFTFWWDEQAACLSCMGGGDASATQFGGASTSPEADTPTMGYPQQMGQITWTSQVSSRFLLEAAYGLGPRIQYGGTERPGNDRDLIRVQEQAGIVPGLFYRAHDWSRPWGATHTFRGALSYVTGRHNMKVGGSYALHMLMFLNFYNNHRLHYRFRNGVPNQLTMFALHGARRRTNTGIVALYAQDQWTLGRLTLQGGIRFEHIGSHFPEQRVGPDRFIPDPIVFPAQDAGVNVKDISPRFGAAYDLFGSGKTAVKASLGRFPTPENSFRLYGNAQNPTTRFAGQTDRAWNDVNRNFVPDCDLLNPAANGECGPWSNRNFGRVVPAITYDPAVLNGWNVREYTWDLNVGVEHEIVPRVSVEVGYVRRMWGNFTVTDNRAVGSEDFDQFSLSVPADSRLPSGGGHVLRQIYDVKPAKFGQIDNYVTFANNYGKQREHYSGVDVTVDARLRAGLTLAGGFTTGRKSTNNCEIVGKLPEALTIFGVRQPLEFCDQQTPFLTQVKGLATYTIPRIDVQIAGTFQSKPYVGANFPSIASESLVANWVVPNALIAPSLGRSLAGGAAVALVNLVKPGTLYGNRISQIDFRVGKIVRAERGRMNIALDIYNLFNSSAVESYQQFYGPSWLAPTAIMPARFAKLSLQFDF